VFGKPSAGVLLEFAKYFDNVNLASLVDDVVEMGHLAPLLIIGFQLYIGPRVVREHFVIRLREGVAAGITPGCVRATNAAKFYLLQPLRRAAAKHDAIELRRYIDDLHLRASGGPWSIQKTLAPAM
jgi:hypothetical protein